LFSRQWAVYPRSGQSRGRGVQQKIGNETKIPRRRGGRRASAVSAGGTGQIATTNPIDEYLAALDEPKRTTLTSLRDTIMAIVPDAEQRTSHGGDASGRGVGHYRSGRQRPDAIA
jgi:hypothetical protein